MFVKHFVDPDLKAEIIFRKEGTAENEGIDFEIGRIGTSLHWYWRLEKFNPEPIFFFIIFSMTKKNIFEKLF